jgi:hypothetical protein
VGHGGIRPVHDVHEGLDGRAIVAEGHVIHAQRRNFDATCKAHVADLLRDGEARSAWTTPSR